MSRTRSTRSQGKTNENFTLIQLEEMVSHNVFLHVYIYMHIYHARIGLPIINF